jgi:hypothetical protein
MTIFPLGGPYASGRWVKTIQIASIVTSGALAMGHVHEPLSVFLSAAALA